MMNKKHIILYNPKFLGDLKNRVVNTAKVKDMFAAREEGRETGKIIEKPGVYTLAPGEIKKFRVDVAEYLLKKYQFIVKVKPEEIEKVLKENKEKKFKCEYCAFQTDTRVALTGHTRTHGVTDETKKILDEIPEAGPDAFVIGAESSDSGKLEYTPLEKEGIPEKEGTVDKDGVEWYGEGVQKTRKRGTAA